MNLISWISQKSLWLLWRTKGIFLKK